MSKKHQKYSRKNDVSNCAAKNSVPLNGAAEACAVGSAITQAGAAKSGAAEAYPSEGKSPSVSVSEDLRLNPEARLCPKFDSESIAKFPVAKRSKMGLRVVDNCAEEHIM